MQRRDFLASAGALAVSALARAQIIPPKPTAMGFASGASAPPGTGPVITSLAPLTLQVPNWTDFITKTGGKTWATNTAYASPYGSTLRRLSNRSTLTNGSSCGLEYSEGAAKISRQINGNQYWVGFVDANNAYYVGKYQLGLGLVSYFTPTWSASVEGNLGVCFSMMVGEENIVYVASKGAQTIQRYDCSTQSWSSNTIFSGANATYTFPNGNGPGGWMQTSWDGSRLVWMSTWAGLPATVYCLMLSGGTAGTLYQYSGSPTGQMQVQGAVVTSATTTTVTVSGASWSPGPDGNGLWANQGVSITFTSGVNSGTSKTITHNTSTTITWSGALGTAPSAGDTFNVHGINELHMFRGSTNAVVIEANTGLGQLPMIWFPVAGVTTQLVGNGASYDYYGGHADAGARVQYTVNPQGILFAAVKTLQSYSIGTAPGADGGSYTGTVTTLMGTNAATDIDNGSADGHFNMTWDQSSATVGNEWTLKDSNGDLYPASTGTWTNTSGSIWQTTVTFDSHFLQSSRGVVGVLITNGTAGSGGKYLGNLTAAASLAAMTAGTYFVSGTTLYVWMPDSTQPNTTTTNHVLVSSAALSTWFNVYFKEDGSDARILCPTYSLTNDGESIYLNEPFVNSSPDGLVAFFNSDLGTYDGFVDLIAAELPTS